MDEAASRADVTSRVFSEENWDAAVHAEIELGTIDLGCAYEPNALGLVFAAPSIGHIKMAFDLTPDGRARLAAVSRELPDGTQSPIELGDQHQLLEFEASAKNMQARIENLEKDLTAAQLALTSEKDARLLCMGERERVRAELERLQQELDAGSATLIREISEARAATAVCESERSKISAEFTELSNQLREHVRENEALKSENERLRAQSIGADRPPKPKSTPSAASAAAPAAGHAERQSIEDAHLVARQLKASLEQAHAERDEARGIARSLHQRLNAEAGQIQTLIDQLALERKTVAQLTQERNDCMSRLLSLTS